jgi:branched-chain amino acid transport system ATP-binding protein
LLEVKNLQAGYGCLQVLWDVSLTVAEGEFVALIGSNGAGKTTTLRAMAGLIRPQGGEIRFLGKPLTGLAPHLISRLGVSYVTEELNLFEAMSVRENLLLGAYFRRGRRKIQATLDYIFQLFPVLEKRQRQLAGTLSGGERRMLALGRGLMSAPRLLLVDEPSLGLAPLMVNTVFEALKTLHQQGVTLLLVEQNVNTTLHLADKAYVLERGNVVLQGPSACLLENPYLRDTYLGKR